MILGLSHVHTDFSHDGDIGIQQLSEIAIRYGVSFVLLSEHADQGMNNDLFAKLKEDSNYWSSDSLKIIPGLEFVTDEGFHVLGFGVDRFFVASDFKSTVDAIRLYGGFSVLAHPVQYAFEYRSVLDCVDAVEVQNSLYDGVIAPRWKAYNLYNRIRKTNRYCSTVAGPDLHKKQDMGRAIYLHMELDRLDFEHIIECLKSNRHLIGTVNRSYSILNLNMWEITLMMFSEYFLLPLKAVLTLFVAYLNQAYKQAYVNRDPIGALLKVYKVALRVFKINN